MNETITRIVDAFFQDIVPTPETEAMREEILNNCQERYRDLIAGGMEEQAACSAILESLGGMEEVLARYPRKAAEAPVDEAAFESVGFEEAFSASSRLAESHTIDAGRISEIRLDMPRDNIVLIPSEDHLIHVTCMTPGNLIEAEENGGVLILTKSAEKQQTEEENSRFTMEIDAQNLGDVFRQVFSKLNLKKVFSEIGKMVSGDEIRVEIPNLRRLNVKLHTASGNITCQDVALNEAEFTTASGDISLDSVEARRCRISGTSGDLAAEATRIDGEMLFNTTSGDVYFGGICGAVTASSISGDVEMELDAGNIFAKSVSGDVEITLQGTSLRQMNLSNVSGDLELNVPGNMPLSVSARSVSGEVALNHFSSPGGAAVQMNTVSGDITVG